MPRVYVSPVSIIFDVQISPWVIEMFTVASVRRAVAHGKLPAAAFAALQRGIGDDRSSFDAAAAQVAEAFQGTGIKDPPQKLWVHISLVCRWQ